MSINRGRNPDSADQRSSHSQPKNLEAMLDLLRAVASEGDRVSLDDGFTTIGRRSFGPVVLFAGLLARSGSFAKQRKAVAAMRKPSRFIDRLLKPRLTDLVRGVSRYAVALACTVTALMTPAMEFIPFSANGAGLIWVLFGLALITQDGFVALLGYCLAGGVLAIIVVNLI